MTILDAMGTHREQPHRAGTDPPEPVLWYAAPPASEIRFMLRDLGLSEISGRVRSWRGTLVMDLEHPARSSVDVVIDAGSLETGAIELDNHTRSSGFLDITRFPEIRFRSREVLVRDEGRRMTIVGDLTIRATTREVRVEAVREGGEPVRSSDTEIAFSGGATIRRRDFGLRWFEEHDRDGLIAGDQVDVEIRIEARRAPAGPRSAGLLR